jgi:hypothetical protein
VPGVGDEQVTRRIERDPAGPIERSGAHHGAHPVRRGGRGRREGGQGDRDARDERGERHDESAHRIIMPVADAAGTGGAP